jgi:hypothetical protein
MDSIVMFISIVFLNILLLILITIYYYQKHRINLWAIGFKLKHQSISKDLQTNANYLWSFRPIQEPHNNILYIHQNQTRFILEDAIRQAKQSQRFTIVSKTGLLPIDSMFLHIEMIQETRTLVAFVEYSHEIERFTPYYYILRRFFMNIFHESKTIQIWGNIRQQMRSYTQYGLFSFNETLQKQCMDVQKEFKLWYNRTFRHHVECQHYLKYDNRDGLSCICAHRPYKSTSNQWSIERAIKYTFDEQLDTYQHNTHQCMAISKLAHIVYKQWTLEQLDSYKTLRLH